MGTVSVEGHGEWKVPDGCIELFKAISEERDILREVVAGLFDARGCEQTLESGAHVISGLWVENARRALALTRDDA